MNQVNIDEKAKTLTDIMTEKISKLSPKAQKIAFHTIEGMFLMDKAIHENEGKDRRDEECKNQLQ